MKKTFLAVFFSLFMLSTAHADLGVNLGVSAQIGSMETQGKETSSAGTSQTSQVEEHIFATAGLSVSVSPVGPICLYRFTGLPPFKSFNSGI